MATCAHSTAANPNHPHVPGSVRHRPGRPQRELAVRGKGGKDRIVRIGHQAARSLDRYLRTRSRHAHARRPQLWLGVNNQEPLTAAGIYQMITRRGRQAGVDAFRTGFGTTSATPSWTAAAPRET